MQKIYAIFLIIPVALFFSGFLVARQLRALQNVPLISMLFVQRKWLMSAGLGIFISAIVSSPLFFAAKFSGWSILAFIFMVLIASASHYFGITVGWGPSLSVNESVIPSNQTPTNTLPENVIVDNTPHSVKITINTRKRWGWFVMSLFQWVVVGFCALPIVGLMLISVLQSYLPENIYILIWILVGGLVLYLMYTKFQETLEYIFDKEIVEIDNLAVKIEKHGSSFKSRKEYSADNIKKITVMFSFGGTNKVVRRSPFVNSNIPAFMMWHTRGLKRYHSFGRAIDLADAQTILETIYSKFPQYKG